MKRMPAALFVMSFVLGSIVNHVVVASASMPVPTSVSFHKYDAEATPFLSEDPASAQPVAIGNLAEVAIHLPSRSDSNAWAGPVDIYFGVQILPLGSEIYLFLQDRSLKPLSEAGLLPWKTEVTAPATETLLGGNIPASALPPGVYRLLLGVTPSGSMNAMELWQADFLVGWWQEQEIQDKIMASFGEEGGFCAIALAADKGYSVNQIVCAATSDRLSSSGSIATYSGLAEPSVNPPFNILTGDAQFMMLEGKKRIVLSELLSNAKAKSPQGEAVFLALLDLLNMGYSPEQAFEGILSGDVIVELASITFGSNDPEIVKETYITDAKGERVVPAFPQRPIISNLASSLQGDTSLTLEEGEAEGSWTVKVKNPKVCVSGHFAYAMNWGEGWENFFQEAQEAGPSFTASHKFTKEGYYQIRAVVGCQRWGSGSTPVSNVYLKDKTVSPTLVVEVKESAPNFPYSLVDIKLKWEASRIFLRFSLLLRER